MWIEKMLQSGLTYTKPGSISYLLYGEKPSQQSIHIKLGKLGEFISKELIKYNPNLELLTCGPQMINDKKKDVDLIFKNEKNRMIYYRELKGNIELDTEKIPATIQKCKEIELMLKNKYSDYQINSAILNWSIYDKDIFSSGVSNIKSFELEGLKIEHMKDYLKTVNIVWNEEDYYLYFREIGIKVQTLFIE